MQDVGQRRVVGCCWQLEEPGSQGRKKVTCFILMQDVGQRRIVGCCWQLEEPGNQGRKKGVISCCSLFQYQPCDTMHVIWECITSLCFRIALLFYDSQFHSSCFTIKSPHYRKHLQSDACFYIILVLYMNPAISAALWPFLSGFGGLEVACWPLVPKFAGSHPAEAVGFLGRKIPQHAFLRSGSKVICPMS